MLASGAVSGGSSDFAAATCEPADQAGCRRRRSPGFDELAVRYQATVHIAAINEWLRPTLEAGPSRRRVAA
ncbi:hypothetical protein Acsp04_40320 [Actinomadura sp. NBRC 104425]|nr:hypothetical protein Acsp04_40320 [Actinomadura sp. NBRC 104425]